MEFYKNTYYHLYNRTNNEEALFRSEENYLYFLKKYRYYLEEYFETVGYCLMPTHFHFLVRVNPVKDGAHLEGGLHLQDPNWQVAKMGSTSEVESIYSRMISDKIGIWLSSYTKAINKRYGRHGSLFQNHTNAKPVPSDRYLITLLTYIHQNPVRSKLVDKEEDWRFSSYQDYIDLREGTLPKKELILCMIKMDEMREITRKLIINPSEG